MKFEHIDTPFLDLLFGNTSGSLGETSGLLLLLGGIYLWWRRDLDWRIPVGILGTAMLFSLMLFIVDADKYPGPMFYYLLWRHAARCPLYGLPIRLPHR